MAALSANIKAPEFTLTTLDGRRVSLAEAHNKGPVLLAFFKVSCPVCQYAFPFYERVYQANKDQHVTVLGISQDNAPDSRRFLREFGVSFPVALDEADGYAVSNAYGLTNVPTTFLIGPGGEIEVSSVGWSKQDVDTMNQRLAAYRHQAAPVLWTRGEDVRDFRAG
jgi:peroxiredoxin